MFVPSGSNRDLGPSKHLLAEAAAIVCLSTAIAATVFAAGTWAISAAPTGSPVDQSAHPGCRQTPLSGIGGSGVSGRARLCLGGERMSLTVEAENLTVGNSYTAWLTYLDQDRAWTDESLRDVPDPRPAGLAGRIDGQVAEAR